MRWHLKYNGEPAECEAQTEESCPRGKNVPHFSSPEEASRFYQKLQEDGGNLLPLVSKKHAKKYMKIAVDKSDKKDNDKKLTLNNFTKVAGGVLVAIVAINGITSIANKNNEPEVENLDDVSSGEFYTPVSSNTSKEQPDYVSMVKDNQVAQDVKEELNKAGDWVKSNEWVQEKKTGVSNWLNNNDWVQKQKAKIKDWSADNDFSKGYEGLSSWAADYFENQDSYDTILTVEDDGSIKWGSKSLTPTKEEVDEAKKNLSALKVAPENKDIEYDREGMFGTQGDKTRGFIESRDLTNAQFNNQNRAISGTLKDVYTGETLNFNNGDKRPYDLEHIVALKEIARSEDPSNPLTPQQRIDIANDPDNLILVSSSANRSKSDKDAKEYLPSYKPSECRFAIETITVKSNYKLNVDPGEKSVLESVLNNRCEIN